METIIFLDNHTIYEKTLIAWLVEFFPRYRIVVLELGESLLQYLENERAVLCIMNFLSPTYDGLDLMRQLREKYPALKIMLTANANEPLYTSAASCEGADDFFYKYDGLIVLLEKIKRLVGQDRIE